MVKKLKDGKPKPRWSNRIQRIKVVDSETCIIPQNGDFLKLLQNYRILVEVHKKLRKEYIIAKSKLIKLESIEEEEIEEKEWEIEEQIKGIDEETQEVVNSFNKYLW